MKDNLIQDIKLNSIADLQSTLFRVCEVNSQDALANSIGIHKSTLSRILTTGSKMKTGPKIENIEKIVRALQNGIEANEEEIREKVYTLVYDEDYVQKQLEAFIIWKKNRVKSGSSAHVFEECGKDSAEVVKETNQYNEPVDVKEALSKNIEEVLEKIVEIIGYKIESRETGRHSEVALLFSVSSDISSCFLECPIDMVYGLLLTEDNYTEIIHNVMGLNSANGIIVLCCQNRDVLDKAWRDEMLRVENNVLLYCLSEKRKFYLKSCQKGQKSFFKNNFREENLIFPKK